MKIKIISEIDMLNSIRENWNDLFVHSGRSSFQSFEFIYYSWQMDLQHNNSNNLAIVVLEKNKRISAILPLYIDVEKRLRFINDIHSDYCDFLSLEDFNLTQVISDLGAYLSFNSVHFINISANSTCYKLYINNFFKHSLLKQNMQYSEMLINKGAFPDNITEYQSKQKTEFRRIKKKNIDNDFFLLSKDNAPFPKQEVIKLKNRMLDLGLRRSDFLTQERLLFIETLYTSGRLVVSLLRKNNNCHAVSFILQHENEYLFWIDLYDHSSKMLNIYNYICFIEHISKEKSVIIGFGRGAYRYKLVNFRPEMKDLFSIYIFRNNFYLSCFKLICLVKYFLRSIYRLMYK